MFKRSQVLLTDWLEEHMKIVSERIDFSFSEMIRIFLCNGILHTASAVFPDSKSRINQQLLLDISKEGASPKTSQEKRHQLASKLYFETRKIVEHTDKIMKKELKQKGRK